MSRFLKYKVRSKTTQQIRKEKDNPTRCEICDVLGKELKRGLCYDHDHKTGEFRGWLCNTCNLVLGMVNDNKELLSKMIIYLK